MASIPTATAPHVVAASHRGQCSEQQPQRQRQIFGEDITTFSGVSGRVRLDPGLLEPFQHSVLHQIEVAPPKTGTRNGDLT